MYVFRLFPGGEGGERVRAATVFFRARYGVGPVPSDPPFPPRTVVDPSEATPRGPVILLVAARIGASTHAAMSQGMPSSRPHFEGARRKGRTDADGGTRDREDDPTHPARRDGTIRSGPSGPPTRILGPRLA